jgi:hypothetical protein
VTFPFEELPVLFHNQMNKQSMLEKVYPYILIQQNIDTVNKIIAAAQ